MILLKIIKVNNIKFVNFLDIDITKHHYILIRNLHPKTNEQKVKNIFKEFSSLQNVIKVSNSSSVYLKFSSLKEIKNIMKQHLVAPFYIGHKKLNLCLVNKLPLDLNQKSKIVLVTVYNEKIKINVFTFYHLFKSYGEIKKIIIFKKKNYQVFIEFGSAEQAHIFKEALHNINYKNYFYIKIQFTQKKELIVNQNSLFEYNFSEGNKANIHSPISNNYNVKLFFF